MTDSELRDMLIEYMGKGFLENIIDMFRHEPSLFRFIPDMIKAEDMRIRIGAVAVVEELKEQFSKYIEDVLPELEKLIKEGDSTLRGDGAYLLSLLITPSAHELLKKLSNDENPDVREIAEEALKGNSMKGPMGII